MTTGVYWCERAWLGPGRLAEGVLVEIADRYVDRVTIDVRHPPQRARQLTGITIPGLANCHSHAFHRMLRGHAQTGQGSFWTWRERMYTAAAGLDPDGYHELARSVYAEMLSGGVTAVGEFHYLHHGPGGARYADPNAMGEALIAAAVDVGLRITMLDTCYLAGGIGKPVTGVQERFSDGGADRWAQRAEDLRVRYQGNGDVVIGAAVHSVRAVPREEIGTVAAWARAHSSPLHVHLSEQVAENDECTAAYGHSPTRVLHDAGALGPRTTAVHATHLTADDIELLGGSQTHACFCPTTERDLADGVGPSRRLADAGSALTLGSDSHAVIDMFEEMRAVEMNERLVSQRRGHWTADELLRAASCDGHASLGFGNAGMIAPGAWADLVTVRTDSWRTRGTGGTAQTLVFAATGADVTHVVAGGRVVVA